MEKLKKLFSNISKIVYHSANLEGNGERVDIIHKQYVDFDKFDMYQKSHYSRYEFAKKCIAQNSVCGDFACGTGYGSIMLADKAKKVVGVDINLKVINEIRNRYKMVKNVEFIHSDLLDLSYESIFDTIVSFETIEHLAESDILKLLQIYNKALKSKGKIIFSTPYMQERSVNAKKLGFHLTFNINEEKITEWLDRTNFTVESFKYQNYKTHLIQEVLEPKDFIIGMAQKK